MASTLVIYCSKYGTTKQYAKWIAKSLEADIKPLEEVFEQELIYYDTIILGTFFRLGHLYHYRKMKKLTKLYPPHLLVTFGVGLNTYQPPLKEDEANSFFYFQGALDYQSCSLKDKFLLFTKQLKLSKQQINRVNQACTLPLIHYVKTHQLN